jgi:predicted nucleic acid-binding protein
MATRYSLKDVVILQNRNIFVDTNVLIYCFWGTGMHEWEQNYASVFKALLHQKNSLFIDFNVISEIVNRMLRIEQKKLQPTNNFKDFRDSKDGKNSLADIFLIVKQNILPQFNVIGKIFCKQEIENLLTVDNLDFVDKSTIEICKENALILLTNDKDFRNTDIDILTGNPNILKKIKI